MAKFYKYRSLENLKRFLEIVMNRKLWSSTYKELNDPMEGVFQYDPGFKGSNFIRMLQSQKQHTYICARNLAIMHLYRIAKSIEKGIELNNYVSFVWDELSKISLSDDSVKSQLKFIRREWVMQAVYEGLIFSSLLFGIIFGIEVNTVCIIWHIIIGVLVELAFVILMFYKATESGHACARDLIVTYLNHSQKPITPKILK